MSERDVSPSQLPFKITPRRVVTAIVVILLIVIAASSFFTVNQTEEAVVLRFGRYDRTVGPGLHFKLPFGIEKNRNVPTQVIQNMQFGFRENTNADFPEESIMLTGDLNIIDVEWIIQYRIDNPRSWLFNVEQFLPAGAQQARMGRGVDQRRKTIRDISQSVINRLVGDRALLDVIGQARQNIQDQGRQQMNEIFQKYGLGIDVTQVRLRDIVPPAGRVQDAFEDVNRAVQDMNRLINEGREQYNKEIPKARGEADRIIQEAEGYAAQRVNEAQGDAARFNAVLAEYEQSEEVTRTRLYYESMEKVFENKEGLQIIDRSLENLLPLMNLGQGGGNLLGSQQSAQQAQQAQQSQGGQ